MRKTVLRTVMALLLVGVMLCGSMMPGIVSKVEAAGKTDVTVQIVWNDGDDADGLRPEDVEVVLWAKTDLVGDTTLEGTGINGTVKLNEAGGWKYTWNGLPSDLFGFVTVYSYYVKEQSVDGYDAPVVTQSGNNWTITYNHTPTSKPDPEPPANVTDVTVNVVWNDGNDADGLRPNEVEVQLTSTFVAWDIPNDIKYVLVKAADGWTYTWKNLPLDVNGDALAYSVNAYFLDANYGKPSVTHDGNVWTVTYTHTPTNPPIEPEPEPDPNKAQVSVRVVWDDEGDVDGLRPPSVKVGLVKDWSGYFEEIISEIDVSGENSWAHTWINLPIEEDGVSITYSVRAYSIGTDYDMPVITNDGDSWTVVYTHTPTPKQDELTERTVTIVWEDDGNKYNTRPNAIPVMLWVRYGSGANVETLPYEQRTLSAANEWKAIWSDLPIRDNYLGTFSYYPYSGDKNLDSSLYIANYEDPVISHNGNDWTIKYTLSDDYRKTDVTVSIEWSGDEEGNRPDPVEVTLYADGVAVETVALTAANHWSYTWTSLPEWNGSKLIEYTVEQPKLDGYRPGVTSTKRTESSEGSNGKVEIVLKNIAFEEVSVTVDVNWIDLEDVARPTTIELRLYRGTGYRPGFDSTNNPEGLTELLDEELVYDSIVFLSADENGNWTYTWRNLPKYNSTTGAAFVYTVREVVPTGYSVYLEGDKEAVNNHFSFILTNRACHLSVITINKNWDDADDQDGRRPSSIFVELYRREKQGDTYTEWKFVQMLEIKAEDGWTLVLDEVPYLPGVEYMIQEKLVTDYTTVITQSGTLVDGDLLFAINNIHTPEVTEYTVHKKWVDNNNQDGIRPEQITVTIKGSNGKTYTATFSGTGDNWSYTFTNLPKYYDGGKSVTYTVVSENAVPGYSPSIEGDTITNTHTPEVTEYTVHKKWADNSNQDGVRPDQITVTIKGSDGNTYTATFGGTGNDWSYTFTKLPKCFNNGELIVYTVESENAVPGYAPSIDGDTVTNTHVTEVTEYTVYKTWADNNNQDGIRPKQITVTIKGSDGNTYTATFGGEGNDWSYTFTGLPKRFNNGELIVYTLESEEAITGYTPSIDGDTVTNTHTPEVTKYTVYKKWADNSNQDGIRPEQITVTIKGSDGKTYTATFSGTGDNWSYTFTNLPKFFNNGELITYTVVSENAVLEYTPSIDGDTITNTHTPEVTKYTVYKKWVDNSNQDGIRPAQITVTIKGSDGKTYTATFGGDGNDWSYTFTDLPKHFNNGELIIYTVESEEVVTDYTPSIEGDTITNEHTPEVTEYTVYKKWADNSNQDGIRPEQITVTIKGSNGKTYTATFGGTGDNWSYTFTNLPKFFNNGELIVYTVDSEEVITDYTPSIEGNTVTNTHTPEVTEYTVYKKWVDNSNQDGIRPAQITVTIKGSDGKTYTATFGGEGNDWSYTFTDLPKYFNNGELIIYTVDSEEVITDYTPSIEGDTVTNEHTPEVTEYTVYKKWADNSNQDGIRPEQITVTIKGSDGNTYTATFSGDGNDWSYTFTDLPKYFNNGELIVYTVDSEDEISGYISSIDGDTITNTHATEATEYTVYKKWADNSNQDGIRPEQITVTIKGSDGNTYNATFTGTGDEWSYTFTELPKFFNNGELIVYTLDSEEEIPGYTSSIEGDTVTNEHTPEVTEYTVHKKWEDNGDQDGIRPEQITVTIKGSDGSTYTATFGGDGDEWSYTFAELPKFFNNGELIAYTVDSEDAVSGYTSSIEGDTVTNTHTPEVTAVTVEKVWEDDDDADGMRPEEIEVTLTGVIVNGDGKKETVVRKTVTLRGDAEGWSYTWSDLPVYMNGAKITYTVEEDRVEGYESEIRDNKDGTFTITNTHISSPQTGDNSHIGLWILLMAISAAGLIVTVTFGIHNQFFRVRTGSKR